jgi:hypothetical protein
MGNKSFGNGSTESQKLRVFFYLSCWLDGQRGGGGDKSECLTTFIYCMLLDM